MADGHPSPTFKWQEMETDEENPNSWKDIHSHSNFSVKCATSSSYRCVATNVVRGKTYSAVSYQFQIKNAGNIKKIFLYATDLCIESFY